MQIIFWLKRISFVFILCATVQDSEQRVNILIVSTVKFCSSCFVLVQKSLPGARFVLRENFHLAFVQQCN